MIAFLCCCLPVFLWLGFELGYRAGFTKGRNRNRWPNT